MESGATTPATLEQKLLSAMLKIADGDMDRAVKMLQGIENCLHASPSKEVQRVAQHQERCTHAHRHARGRAHRHAHTCTFISADERRVQSSMCMLWNDEIHRQGCAG